MAPQNLTRAVDAHINDNIRASRPMTTVQNCITTCTEEGVPLCIWRGPIQPLTESVQAALREAEEHARHEALEALIRLAYTKKLVEKGGILCSDSALITAGAWNDEVVESVQLQVLARYPELHAQDDEAAAHFDAVSSPVSEAQGSQDFSNHFTTAAEREASIRSSGDRTFSENALTQYEEVLARHQGKDALQARYALMLLDTATKHVGTNQPMPRYGWPGRMHEITRPIVVMLKTLIELKSIIRSKPMEITLLDGDIPVVLESKIENICRLEPLRQMVRGLIADARRGEERSAGNLGALYTVPS